MEVRLESTDGPGRQAEVWVDGTLLVVMDEYSRPGEQAAPGLLTYAKFVYMTEQAFSWADAAAANRSERRLLEPLGSWRYAGYGRVVQIMPVVIDFGLLCMEDANWTNDEKLVGKFVRVPIDRLSLTHQESNRWPEDLR